MAPRQVFIQAMRLRTCIQPGCSAESEKHVMRNEFVAFFADFPARLLRSQQRHLRFQPTFRKALRESCGIEQPHTKFRDEPQTESKRGLSRFELLQNLADRNSSGYLISVDTSADFFTFKVVNPQHRIAPEVFIESRVLRTLSQRVDKQWHELG